MDLINSTCPNGVSIGIGQMLFTELLLTLTKWYCDLYPSYPKDQSEDILSKNEKFDFIVVGAGSAGSAIANRLTEIHSWRVLLIEAGQDPPLETNIPLLAVSTWGSKYDWSYLVEESEKACRSMNGNRCLWPKGKMLGGSSSMNAMLYVRGNSKDYDAWEKLGNTGWGYKDVLKYFKKLEKFNAKNEDKSAHGYDGYVHVEEYKNMTSVDYAAFLDMFKNAVSELGLPIIDDMAANMQSGGTEALGTVENGLRANAAREYLVPIKHRKNFFLMKGTQVTKLLIDDTKTVYGVEVNNKGRYKKILCRKEVVLSAGAVGSPQIMLLSGIGPKKHLSDMQIPVIKNLKVGYNLQDHTYVSGMFIKPDIPTKPFVQTDHMYNYLTRRTELGTIGMSAMMFIDTLNNEIDYPDVQYHTIFFPSANPLLLHFHEQLNLEPHVIKWISELNHDAAVVTILPTLLRPKSVGRLMLASKNPSDPPKLVSGYLREVEDIKTLTRGIKILKKFMNAEAFNTSSFHMVPVKECQKFETDTDEFYECFIRNFISTVFHICGTCKMGPSSDPNAVVDPTLKVYGIKGLRVADASIMPNVVSGNTNIPTIMIGEKAADLIKSDWVEQNYHNTDL